MKSECEYYFCPCCGVDMLHIVNIGMRRCYTKTCVLYRIDIPQDRIVPKVTGGGKEILFSGQRTCEKCGHRDAIGQWIAGHICPKCKNGMSEDGKAMHDDLSSLRKDGAEE